MDPSPPGEGLISNSLEGCGHVTGTWATGGRTGHRPASQPRPCRARRMCEWNVPPSPPCVTVPGETGSPSSPLGASAAAPQRPGTCRGSGPPARGVQGPAVDLRWARGPPQSQARPWAVHVLTAARGGGGTASPANRQAWAVVEGGAALPGPPPSGAAPPAVFPAPRPEARPRPAFPRPLVSSCVPATRHVRHLGFGRLSRRRSPRGRRSPAAGSSVGTREAIQTQGSSVNHIPVLHSFAPSENPRERSGSIQGTSSE